MASYNLYDKETKTLIPIAGVEKFPADFGTRAEFEAKKDDLPVGTVFTTTDEFEEGEKYPLTSAGTEVFTASVGKSTAVSVTPTETAWYIVSCMMNTVGLMPSFYDDLALYDATADAYVESQTIRHMGTHYENSNYFSACLFTVPVKLIANHKYCIKGNISVTGSYNFYMKAVKM